MAALGDILYRAASLWTRLAGNATTTKKFLTQTGTGAVSAAPGWNTIAASDLPDTAVTPGTYGDATHVGQFTVDQQGRLTFAADVAVIFSTRFLWQYRAKTTATSGYPGDGRILWNNATQTSATVLLYSHLTDDGLDIDILLGLINNGDSIILQDANDSTNFQSWTVSGTPTNTNPGTATSYWNIPVTLVSSGGTGTTGFPNNHQLISLLTTATSGASVDYVVASDGVVAGPSPINDGAGNFIYVAYTP